MQVYLSGLSLASFFFYLSFLPPCSVPSLAPVSRCLRCVQSGVRVVGFDPNTESHPHGYTLKPNVDCLS